jgi:hypothetical protein
MDQNGPTQRAGLRRSGWHTLRKQSDPVTAPASPTAGGPAQQKVQVTARWTFQDGQVVNETKTKAFRVQ